MMRRRMLTAAGNAVIVAPYRWSLDDSPSPFADTGSAGESRNMTSVGTVSDDAAFGGVSLAGAGAVKVADTAEWIDSIVAGADAAFSVKLRFRLDDMSTDSYLIAKLSTSTAERQFGVVARSSGALDLVWYGALNASSFRVVRVSAGITAGVEYRLAMSYDGSIDTNDGADRPAFYLDGVLQTGNSVTASSGALPGIPAGPAPLAVGARVNSNDSLDAGQRTIGSCADFDFFDYVITAAEAG